MNDFEPLVQFPIPEPFTLKLLAVGFALLLFGAVAYEFNRRRQQVRNRQALEWHAAGEIFEERNLAPDSVSAIERIIKRYAPDHPLRALTTREGFESCVAPEMEALLSKGDIKVFEEAGTLLRDVRSELGLDYVPIGQPIQSTRELHASQWISLSIKDAKDKKWVRMMVQSVNEAHVSLGLKQDPDESMPQFEPGDAIRCRLWRDEDARYLFDTTLADVSDSPRTWKLYHTHELRRTQARTDFRVRHDQPVSLGIVNARLDENDSATDTRPIVTQVRGRITSLSAGGFAVVVNQAVSRQVELRLKIELPETMVLDTEAQIVSSSAISGGRYLIRARFNGLLEDERDLIAKHVMQKQQAQLAEQNQTG